jgi:hypothetical protein
MYYGGFSYIEAYNIPVWQRFWFVKRISKEIEKANGGNKAESSQARAWSGKHRSQAPMRQRRFT